MLQGRDHNDDAVDYLYITGPAYDVEKSKTGDGAYAGQRDQRLVHAGRVVESKRCGKCVLPSLVLQRIAELFGSERHRVLRRRLDQHSGRVHRIVDPVRHVDILFGDVVSQRFGNPLDAETSVRHRIRGQNESRLPGLRIVSVANNR